MLGLPQLFRKETVVGVDIGSRLMKICYVEAAGLDRWRVSRTSFAPTPKDAVRDGVVIDKAAVGAALRELLKSANLSHVTGANAAIAGASVIVRHVKMPRIAEAVLRKSVRYEASKYISSSIDTSCIEFEILGPVVGEPDKMNVMLVAGPNDMINSRIEALELAGLDPVAIDVESFAVQRALLEMGGESAYRHSTLALLDIGASSTDVTIVTHGYFALTRNVSIAGDQFTNAIRNASGGTFEEAEERKLKVDMSVLLAPEADPDQLQEARLIQPTLDELLREVRRSVNYYQSQVAEGSLTLPIDPRTVEAPEIEGEEQRRAGSGAQVSRLVITGGSAMLKGIKAYMEVRLGTPVDHANIFDLPAFDTTQLAPSFVEANHSIFALGVGLAVKRPAASAVVPSPAPKKLFPGINPAAKAA